MSITLTPERLAAVYDCLRAFPPYAAWRLPPSEGVIFRVTRHNDRQAHFTSDIGRRATNPEIVVSERCVEQFETLTLLVAHEMIHFYQVIAKTDANSQHNAEFRRIARRVCRLFNWDSKQFIST